MTKNTIIFILLALWLATLGPAIHMLREDEAPWQAKPKPIPWRYRHFVSANSAKIWGWGYDDRGQLGLPWQEFKPWYAGVTSGRWPPPDLPLGAFDTTSLRKKLFGETSFASSCIKAPCITHAAPPFATRPRPLMNKGNLTGLVVADGLSCGIGSGVICWGNNKMLGRGYYPRLAEAEEFDKRVRQRFLAYGYALPKSVTDRPILKISADGCGLRKNGDLHCWQAQFDYQHDQPFIDLAGTCALDKTGRIMCMMISQPDLEHKLMPIRLPADIVPQKLPAFALGQPSCFIDKFNKAICMRPVESQSSNDKTILDPLALVDGRFFAQVQWPKPVDQLFVGKQLSCGIDREGTAFCWNRGGWQQWVHIKTTNDGSWGGFGSGSYYQPSPLLSPSAFAVWKVKGGFRQLAMGMGQLCGLTGEGYIHCWKAEATGSAAPVWLGYGSRISSYRFSELAGGDTTHFLARQADVASP